MFHGSVDKNHIFRLSFHLNNLSCVHTISKASLKIAMKHVLAIQQSTWDSLWCTKHIFYISNCKISPCPGKHAFRNFHRNHYEDMVSLAMLLASDRRSFMCACLPSVIAMQDHSWSESTAKTHQRTTNYT